MPDPMGDIAFDAQPCAGAEERPRAQSVQWF